MQMLQGAVQRMVQVMGPACFLTRVLHLGAPEPEEATASQYAPGASAGLAGSSSVAELPYCDGGAHGGSGIGLAARRALLAMVPPPRTAAAAQALYRALTGYLTPSAGVDAQAAVVGQGAHGRAAGVASTQWHVEEVRALLQSSGLRMPLWRLCMQQLCSALAEAHGGLGGGTSPSGAAAERDAPAAGAAAPEAGACSSCVAHPDLIQRMLPACIGEQFGAFNEGLQLAMQTRGMIF